MIDTIKLIKQKTLLYLDLTRFNRPVGIFLLLWPTLSALWLAANGTPKRQLIIIFTLGVIFMRSAGCIINDITDRNLDRKVQRTQTRPLAQQKLTVGEALAVFVVLILIAFLLVLLTNTLTIQLSFIALGLACTYPLMKRITHFPQLVLGIAFAMGIPMAFSAQSNKIPNTAWLLFLSTILWTIAYDTIYALMDREDDIVANIKSTAILFGDQDQLIIGFLQALTLLGLILLGLQASLSLIYFFGLMIIAANFAYQHKLIQLNTTSSFLQAFSMNSLAGACLFLSVMGGLYF